MTKTTNQIIAGDNQRGKQAARKPPSLERLNGQRQALELQIKGSEEVAEFLKQIRPLLQKELT
jgi:hypothetical protein